MLLEEDEFEQLQRAAARHAFPAGSIDTMLAEIESGYGVESSE